MDYSEIKNRILALIDLACRSSPSNDRFSNADLDELIALAKIAKGQLPASFHSILGGVNYGTSSRTKNDLGERLLRALSVYEKYGEIETGSVSEGGLLPRFELGKKDKSRIFELCDKMRKIIFVSDFFDEAHKVRLLDRIAAIEKETHQTKGKLDVVLAGIVDTGDALGKFGEKVKPLTDRMKEVAQIARKGSKQYDQIPAPDEVKQLPAPEEAGDDVE